MIRVVQLSLEPWSLDHAKELIAEYVMLPDAWGDSPPLDLPQRFRDELDELPGDAAPPRGELVIAYLRDRPVGVGLLRPVDSSRVEMKRLYVRPEARRAGIATAIVGRLIDEAASLGYARLMLDVMSSRSAAIALYRSLGFADAEAYRSYDSFDLEMTTFGLALSTEPPDPAKRDDPGGTLSQ